MFTNFNLNIVENFAQINCFLGLKFMQVIIKVFKICMSQKKSPVQR